MHRTKITLILTLTVVLVLALTAALVAYAQGPEDEEDVPGQPIEPAVFPDDPTPDQEDVDPAGVGAAAYIVNPTMNYQGFLTDSGGSPVNDTLDFTVSLWDQEGAGAGVQWWGPEVHNNVDVARGLFSLVLGSSVALEVQDFLNALYLEIEVDGTTLPRQPLRGVPYAMTLAPGAYIEGDDDTWPMISVRQQGAAFAIWAQENGISHYGLGADRIYASEGYASGSDSYLWVPGSLAYTPSAGVTLDPKNSGKVTVDCSLGTGSKTLYIPVAITSRLYGHNVYVEEARVYYSVSNSTSPIYLSRVRVLESDGSAETIAQESDDQDSTTYTSFVVPIDATSGYTLTSASGPLTVFVGWECNDVNHELDLGGVRLRLGHPRSDL